jgi:hypothetical protein
LKGLLIERSINRKFNQLKVQLIEHADVYEKSIALRSNRAKKCTRDKPRAGRPDDFMKKNRPKCCPTHYLSKLIHNHGKSSLKWLLLL